MRPLKHHILWLSLLVCVLASCNLSNTQKAHKVFKHGCSLVKDATHELDQGNLRKSIVYNKMAVKSFRQVLELDSTHLEAPSALAHAYFLMRDYQHSAEWYQKALANDSSSTTVYFEYGLCEVNNKKLPEGKALINTALILDCSESFRKEAVRQLIEISTLKFNYGLGYEQEGNLKHGLALKQYAIAVLLYTYTLDNMNTDVIKRLIEYSYEMGDITNSNQFRARLNAHYYQTLANTGAAQS